MAMNKSKRRFGGAINEHWTQKKGIHVPKVAFDTLDDCLYFMERKRISKDVYHPYVCSECGQWHIGHYTNKKK